MSGAAHPSVDPIRTLWRTRPRNHFLRISLGLFVALMIASWFLGDFDLSDTFSETRTRNFARFTSEMRPYPLRERAPDGGMRDKPWDWGVAGAWASERLTEGVSGRDTPGGWDAALGTLAISVFAIVLASLCSLVLCWFAARTVATPQPFAPGAAEPTWPLRWFWRGVVGGTRTFLILLRSLPEYVLAFLIFAIVQTPAWPAAIALAIHNTGILGRLNAETIENVETRPLVALRALGASRTKVALSAIAPTILPRLLLYFFYRWETCVREATVLGMLGLASLGWLIDEAKVNGFRYDEMVFFIGLGVVIVLFGDLLSAIARRVVRQAS